MDYSQLTAPCGIDCFNCPAYLANVDELVRSKVSEALGVSREEAICSGCRSEKGTIKCLRMTHPCNVFQCITTKSYQFCYECSDFPCDYLHPYADKASQRPHNTKVFNLCLIRKMGVESWAKSKAKDVRETYFRAKFKL